MQSNEQQLIESLFTRLKQAAAQSAPRDAAAEQLIQQQAQQVPAAPYYMAQALLIQEAAMKQLNSRVAELESQLAQARQSQPQQSSGSFLSGLFGGGNRQNTAAAQPAWGNSPQQAGYNPAPQAAPAAPRGTGFLGGALQTAVGVAGGVVMADMLTSMFHHSQPQEIVNIINEPSLPQQDFDAADSPFSDQQPGADWQNTGYDGSDFNGFDSNNDNDFAGGDDNNFYDDSFI
ncbi:ABC transporter substrate-binding protein [Erwinia sp. OLTSP20]|uniref:DUF2076 domain-containing protein n=1 Tax=unclassified Erwinia TaxID=2622719 RepID=UPI000C18F677|nr:MULTISPECIES: DUF2076 domain-containing protein [unclassified Erwinia]PIJ49023.1 ABC transporter substrate-binding protein [Erwinia sp. OAMSP11]PIJ75017.1 ABC transporter substrate-binding protein [Erwinia sp. OLSSP12]PIJ79708.1 ABC transporter substrate-binding protein [Erwinia sp. OLCASP19]PIJ80493.1 ABC transporter substrate-binding protein [Erwinia sp. OLMTSP26]PIJ82608.1 ABC transporter substrate-binding protein [Erwinia sp. OLMDSP33]